MIHVLMNPLHRWEVWIDNEAERDGVRVGEGATQKQALMRAHVVVYHDFKLLKSLLARNAKVQSP